MRTLILEDKRSRKTDVVRAHFQKQKKGIMKISPLFCMGRTDGS